MEYIPYSEIEAKVRSDLGLEQEDFISTDEMRGYCNEAINKAESLIHTTYEDYFLTYQMYSVIDGQAEYDMPTNIYANKVRGLIFLQQQNPYTIKRYNDMRKQFEELEQDLVFENDRYFRYFLNNRGAADGIKLTLVPTPSQSEPNSIKMWYLRNANKMIDETSLCDIPEFVEYIYQYMKMRCYEKEGSPLLASAIGVLAELKEDMVSTLNDMTPDGDNEIEMDTSIYWEMGEGVEYADE